MNHSVLSPPFLLYTLAAFLACAVALSTVAVALTPAPMVNPFLFIGCLICFAVVEHLYPALSAGNFLSHPA